MPKGIKDISRMWRYSSEGLTDAAGREIIGAKEMGPGELFMQSMGVQPASVADAYTGAAAIKNVRDAVQSQRAQLLRRFNNTDPENRPDLLQEIGEFNRAHPEAGITRSQLLRSQQSFRDRSARVSQYGVDLRDRELGYAEEAEMYQ